MASPADLLSSMMRSLSLRTRCATASSRGSAAVADWLDAAPAAERLAPLLDARERDRLAVPLLLLRVVRRAPVDPLPLARLELARLPVERLPLERLPPELLPLERLPLELLPLERREELRPDDEPPELEPEPLLLAWGMPSSLW